MNKDTLYTQTPLILDNPPSNVTDIEALYGAFIVSLTLLFVISFIKYFIGTDIKQKEVINIMIELPIDIFTIAITTLITFYYMVAGGNLAASNIRNLECPSYEVYLIDYGCGKFNKKVHIME